MRPHHLLLFALAQAPQQPEVAQQEASITFESKVSEVPVSVVVRDKSGKPVDGLTKEDFKLFDKGRAQSISRLSIERTSVERTTGTIAAPAASSLKGAAPIQTAAAAGIPERFTAFYFDDVHLTLSDLIYARKAADNYLAAGLKPVERAAIFTSSGQGDVDFTDSADALRAGLARLRTRPVTPHTGEQCPAITYYQGDLIVNQNDAAAFRIAAIETKECMQLYSLKEAEPLARAAAQQAIDEGDHETRLGMDGLKDVVRRMGAMPGHRLIVMVSPGFLRLTMHEQEESQIIDRAIRAGITINALDARGLYTDAPADPGKRTLSPEVEFAKMQYGRMQNRAGSDLMAELSSGTGGTLFENSNDLNTGMKVLSALPEVYYVLAFAPQDLKPDGSFHALKVSLPNHPELTLKARSGYYAPNHVANSEEQERSEIAQALFSREEAHVIPADIHTQYLKASDDEARLTVITRIDVRKLRYRKIDGRNGDELVVVSGLFDHNGNFLQAIAKKVTMRLRDETLGGKLNGGISVHADFKVPPGRYLVRMVVRDEEGQMMTAENGAVEIP